MIGKPFNTIGGGEAHNLQPLFFGQGEWPLSGYLAGKPRGGYCVRALEDEWAQVFHVKHAIACNSATSGLLAAAFAIGLKPGDKFFVPAMTMSATAAAPMFTGAAPIFGDVDPSWFALSPHDIPDDDIKAVFLTHLFGAAIDESWWAGWGRQNDVKIVVDAAQAPFAKEPKSDRYAGTIADIGVFSLNVHKPIQCGEGGMVTTDDDALADKLRAFINHGENLGGPIGLNLRMPELCASVALSQLRRGHEIVNGRIVQAVEIINAIGLFPNIARTSIPGLRSYAHPEAINVYYALPFLIDRNRAAFCASLRKDGVPIVEGYVPPLYRLPAFAPYATSCPVAEDLHDNRLFYIENCAWDFTTKDIAEIGEAFRKAAKATL